MRIFLVIPYNREFTDISYVIRDVVDKTNHELIRLDEVSSPQFAVVDILNKEMEKADLIIADISSRNPNVMYELGIAQSLNKPTLLIAQKGEIIPFDISNRRIIFYEREHLFVLSRELQRFLQGANVNDFTKKSATNSPKKTMVFISYSHIDTEYLERLKIHLKPFEKKGLIDIWSDTKIKAGEKWKEQIEKALEKSVAAILLISADFLASDFIIDNELPPLLKSAEEKGKLILPVVLKPCRFTKDENLSKFQAVNNPNVPLSKMDDNGKEEIYVKVADYIDDLVR